MQMRLINWPDNAGFSQQLITDDIEIEVFRGEEKLGSVRLTGVTDTTVLIQVKRDGKTQATTWEAKGL